MKPYWWCPSCKREIDGRHVTYEELCDVCGSAVKIVESEDVQMDLKSHVSEGWVRDIRKWLETQPGATEFDGSPLDGVQRVMQRRDTRIEQLEKEVRLKQSQLNGRDDELSGLKLKIHELHELLKKMVEAYSDVSSKAVYEQRLAKSMADAMDRMDDIVLRPNDWRPSCPQTDADQIVSMVNECAVHGMTGP